MAELLQMSWFQKLEVSKSLSKDKQLDISSNLAAFTKLTNFQSGICSMIANLQIKNAELAECREMFLRFDANNDGFIDIQELQSVYGDIADLFHLEEPDVVQLFQACDANGDGKIDYTEFISAAMEKTLLVSKQNLRAAFDMIDANGDGELTKDELKAVFGGGHVSQRGEEVWDDIMKEVDHNSDGVITIEEFESAMRQIVNKQSSVYNKSLATTGASLLSA